MASTDKTKKNKRSPNRSTSRKRASPSKPAKKEEGRITTKNEFQLVTTWRQHLRNEHVTDWRNSAKQLQEYAAFLRTEMTERRRRQNAAVVQQYDAIEKLLTESHEELTALLKSTATESNLPKSEETDAMRLALRASCQEMHKVYVLQIAQARIAIDSELEQREQPEADPEETEDETVVQRQINIAEMQAELAKLEAEENFAETKHKAKMMGKAIRLENTRTDIIGQTRQCEMLTTAIEHLQISKSNVPSSSQLEIHQLMEEIERLQLDIWRLRREIEEFDANVRKQISENTFYSASK